MSLPSPANAAMRRRDILKDHVRRRFTLDWSRSTFQVPFFRSARLFDGLLIGLGLRSVVCIDLPSAIRGTPYKIWVHDLNFQPYKAVCDAAQDLLILVELCAFHVIPSSVYVLI